MSGTSVGIHITSILGLGGFLLLWIILFECAHALVALLREDPPIAFARCGVRERSLRWTVYLPRKPDSHTASSTD